MNTSPLIWLDKIGESKLITQLYDTIYTTPSVQYELSTFYSLSQDAKEVISQLIIPQCVKSDLNRFNKLVKRKSRKLKFQDIADIQVLITYNLLLDNRNPDYDLSLIANEMLFANKGAETRLKPYGKIRDIAELYELAESKGIFNRNQSIEFLDRLLSLDYRKKYIQKKLNEL